MSIVSLLLLGLGVFFVVTAVVGIVTFPDFYSRAQAVGIADSIGVAMILSGIAVKVGISVLTLKILVLICLLWVTSTTACNALVSSAYSLKD